jgi:hypothetical protein
MSTAQWRGALSAFLAVVAAGDTYGRSPTKTEICEHQGSVNLFLCAPHFLADKSPGRKNRRSESIGRTAPEQA